MANIKEQIKKLSRFIVSRMFYLILGICIAVAIPIAYAAWNTLVNPGETLTATGWNEHVNKLIELNSRTTNLESAPWIEFSNCVRGNTSYVDYFIACTYRVCNSAGCSAWSTGANRIIKPYVSGPYWNNL